MASRSPSRSPSRHSDNPPPDHPSPERTSATPRRTISPRARINGEERSRSPPIRPSRSLSRSRSPDRAPRERSHSRSPPRRSLQPKSAKIIVEKLTKNVHEGHLREIFGSYGPVREIDLPMNRQFNTNRGTAYILFEEMEDAESAIAHMHEAQLDGAVINVSVVLPRRKFSRSPPPSRRVAVHQDRMRGPPPYRGPPPPPGPGRYNRSPPPPLRRGSPPNRRYPPSDRGRDLDTYRPRSYSRSRSPRRSRSRSFSSRSASRSPPPRRGQDYRRRDSPPRRGGGGARGGWSRRSPSYSSYDSYSDRERSRSRDRGDRERGRR